MNNGVAEDDNEIKLSNKREDNQIAIKMHASSPAMHVAVKRE
jgi:hypothetical protein